MNKILSLFIAVLMASNVYGAGISWKDTRSPKEAKIAAEEHRVALNFVEVGGLLGGILGAGVGNKLGVCAAEAMGKFAIFKSFELRHGNYAMLLESVAGAVLIFAPGVTLGFLVSGFVVGVIAGAILFEVIQTPWEETALRRIYSLTADGISIAVGKVSESTKRTGETLLGWLQFGAKLSFDYPEISGPLFITMVTIINSYRSASSAFHEDFRTWNRLLSRNSPDIPVNLFLEICRNTNFHPELLEHIMSFVPDATVPIPNFYNIFQKLLTAKLDRIIGWTMGWQMSRLNSHVVANLSQSNAIPSE